MSHKDVYNKLLSALTDYEIYYTLKTVIDNDCYLNEVEGDDNLEKFFEFLLYYDIIWLTSDKRFLLTNRGENFLHELAFLVEISQKVSKVKKNKNIWKHKTKN
jgi:hypothetical protein